MAEKRTRRSRAETQAVYEKAKALIASGMKITDAIKEVGMASSVYNRYARGKDLETRKSGRRTMEQVAAIIEKMKSHVSKGMSVQEAAAKYGISTSNYYRHVPDRKRGGSNGSMKVSAIPPRPSKRGGLRVPKKFNLNDVGQVAHRIGVIDRKIKRMVPMQQERKRLAMRLLAMLKGSV